ncbi:Uncharacterized protein involved in exopolysaccharide biosynthesis [Arboricoccus pini]|uniref:Uncharacterized protein involved in exopolysaccharide biosynthesis n=1 Tax=Arboricoccus pini TaxID=1963835 RepID=A0A212RRF2_9PROT|nr:polysaccharide biosynthesis tyrosine autokinase [Arboricoccus pini]SNB75131.1 Uncharacterized protein involved in exopolysaccharide biosynthesis [Arboricoccus pini]
MANLQPYTQQGSMTLPRPIPEEQDFKIDLPAAYGALKRHWLLILCLTLLGFVFSTIFALTRDPVYTATTQIMLEPRQMQIVTLDRSTLDTLPVDSAFIETQMRVIQSDASIGKVVDQLNLLNNPVIKSKLDQPPRFYQAWIANLQNYVATGPKIVQTLGGLIIPPPTQDPPETAEARRQRVIDMIQNDLNVAAVGKSYSVSVAYPSIDKQLAIDVVNAVSNRYLQSQVDDKVAESLRAQVWLQGRVNQLGHELVDAEQEIEAYRANNNLLQRNDNTGATLVDQQLNDLSQQLATVQAARATVEAEMVEVNRVRSGGGNFSALTQVVQSDLISRLREREADIDSQVAALTQSLGPNHPRVKDLQSSRRDLEQQIQSQVNRIVNSLQSDLTVQRDREAALVGRINELKAESRRQEDGSVKLRELERRADASRTLYEQFLGRLKESEDQATVLQPDARILVPAALPLSPSSLSRAVIIIAGTFMSALLASALAFALSTSSKVIDSATDIESRFHLPVVAVFPRMSRLGSRNFMSDLERGRRFPIFLTELRRLYVAARMSKHDRGSAAVVQLISSNPKEGKSSLAAALAAFAVRAQERVLLIDLDSLKPSIGRLFDARLDYGIEDVTAGRATLDQAITRVDSIGIDLLSYKRPNHEPTLFLQSRALEELKARVEHEYDLVIIDSSPLLVGSEQLMLSNWCDRLFYVFRAGVTRDRDAQEGLRMMLGSSMSKVLAILNCAPQPSARRDYGRYAGTKGGGFPVRA